MALKSKLLLARYLAPVAVVEWNIYDTATGKEVYRRKEPYTLGVADDGSVIPGETAAQLRARVVATETAVRDAKLLEFAPSSVAQQAADAEVTGADLSGFMGALTQ